MHSLYSLQLKVVKHFGILIFAETSCPNEIILNDYLVFGIRSVSWVQEAVRTTLAEKTKETMGLARN